jgi:hypothetical protein
MHVQADYNKHNKMVRQLGPSIYSLEDGCREHDPVGRFRKSRT